MTPLTKGTTMKIEVFDPAMCCSTGVCGPSVDPDLARFAGDLEWLAGNGVDVVRYNLSSEPQAFVDNDQAKTALAERGDDALPLILADGRPMSFGAYPARDALAKWAGVSALPVAVSGDGSSSSCCGGGSC